jgi:hypothetical protein
MGTARVALRKIPALGERKRQNVRNLLESRVIRARYRFDADHASEKNREAYIEALIRFNEFLLQEKFVVASAPRPA